MSKKLKLFIYTIVIGLIVIFIGKWTYDYQIQQYGHICFKSKFHCVAKWQHIENREKYEEIEKKWDVALEKEMEIYKYAIILTDPNI